MTNQIEIIYLKNSEIDRERWDNCIKRSFNGNIYAFSWYLDIVCDGWEALVTPDYSQVFPLTAKKRWGVKYLYQPPFTQQLGLFSTVTPGGDITDCFLGELLKHYKFSEISLNRYNRVQHTDYRVVLRRNFELDLIQPYLDLKLLYAENTIRNIRKAERESIHISGNADPKTIIQLFRQQKGKQLKQWSDTHYQTLERLIYACLYRNLAQSIGAYDRNNQLVAGMFILQSHHRIVFIFSANNETARATGAMHLLIDEVIRQFAGKPLTFDFEGSDIPGLARFYAGFGSMEVAYPQVFMNKLPWILRSAIWIKHRLS